MSTPATTTKSTSPPSYSLLFSEQTVQQVSQTVTIDVLYCTIQTAGSGVVASAAVPLSSFTSEGVNPTLVLTTLARGIDLVMQLPNVIAGRGSQVLDANDLLVDSLIFTVEYVPPGSTGTSITGEATVPNSAVMGSSTTPGQPGIAVAQAAIDAVYANLQTLAG